MPYEYYEKHAVRRYGFHGTSHKFVSDQAAELIGKPKDELKIITLHLGNGSSISAVDQGRCVDTTMGLTPLAGVPMGTRCGDIDPAIVKFLADSEDLTVAEIDNIMNKQSGMLGVSGVSSDFRDLGAAKDEGNKRAELALNMFMYQCRKVVGSYVAAMGGVDAIVFTAGVGENDKGVREGICDGLEFIGIEIDQDKNRNLERGKPTNVAKDSSKEAVLVFRPMKNWSLRWILQSWLKINNC